MGPRSGIGIHNNLFVPPGVCTPKRPNRGSVTSNTELSPLREINHSQALCFPRAKNGIYTLYPDRVILGFHHAVDEVTLEDGTDRLSRNVDKELSL